MAKNCSFDIASVIDMAEVKNAVNQSLMEIRQRFDFKGSKSNIMIDENKLQLVLISDDDHKMKSVVDILQSKLVKRKVSLKAFAYSNPEHSSGATVRQIVKIQNGISQEKGKAIVKEIKSMKIKAQAQIMDDQVRVTGKNRDDLQDVIENLKQKEFEIDIQFINYR
tara:strand:- start:2009 stop:2506 length:498 start_codon:yes stop_codon:yes gene_type:complete